MATTTDTRGKYKRQVVDRIPKRIRHLQFGIHRFPDIVNQGVVEVDQREVYDLTNAEGVRNPTRHGANDPRMGTSSKAGKCETCYLDMKDCNGHFGHIKLALPAFHVGYLKTITDVLTIICKDCSRILLPDEKKRHYLKRVRRPGLDATQRAALLKDIAAEAKKSKNLTCTYCGHVNGIVRKVAGHPLKIVHMRFATYDRSVSKTKQMPLGKPEFDASFNAMKDVNPELEKHLKKVQDDMHPLRVWNLFRQVSNADSELMGMSPKDARPETLIWVSVPVPPCPIRPSVVQEMGTNEDDITNKISDISYVNNSIKVGIRNGATIDQIMQMWDFLQLQIAMYINGSLPGLANQLGPGTKTIRGFCQRLKGKGGRFRQNLSGKRVDFSGRTVIGPDPNLGIDEVAVPKKIALNLTYPEKANRYNINKLKSLVQRGTKRYPGANFIIKPDGRRLSLAALEFYGDNKLENAAKQLDIGDIVERHLEDGDIVLFNRQPSLHRMSILSHKAKIRPWRTLRLNECACNPYNADFDGDEMNLHVPQTEEARTEAIELMGVKNNLATPKNGTPLIAAIQDFITAAYLMSNKENFFDRASFTQVCSYMFNGDSVVDPDTGEKQAIELPPPTILKPQALWTGKQVFNVLMRPNKKCKVLVNLEAACKQFKPTPGEAPDMNMDDSYLVIRNSEVMCGVMDKATVGDGKKDSVFYVMMRDFGPDYAVQGMNRLAKLSARWLTNKGFSIGINDVTPGPELVRRKQSLIQEAYAKCDELIKAFKEGRLTRDPGCDEEQTMENRIGGILSSVRQDAGTICFNQLTLWNAPLMMAKCGSKGSNINVSQMVASVGQQMIGGARVADGFQDRTLPHFPKAARQPASKGFVSNSFYSGLSPTEFIFHAMSGREGLVDTAVKTAETGYMSRRLMKSLEDLSTQYDNTVRTSSGGIVQFQFGDDNLDPLDMEGKAKPVNFDRTFSHSITSTWNNSEQTLTPEQIRNITTTTLNSERNKYIRYALDGKTLLAYDDRSDAGIDQMESIRDFLDTVQDYIFKKADKLERAIKLVGGIANAQKSRLVDGLAGITETALNTFIVLCLQKYHKSKVEPGHAVGAIGAQSIGEPGTQMTLKTFHFAGVAGMSITQGVPRIKEIMNASSTISTPVIEGVLSNKYSERAARMVKAKIQKVHFGDIVSCIEDVCTPAEAYVHMCIDWDTIQKRFLDITAHDIRKALLSSKTLRLNATGGYVDVRNNTVRVYVGDPATQKGRPTKTQKKLSQFDLLAHIKNLLPSVPVKGYPDCSRVIIKKADVPNEKRQYEIQLLVEGYGLKNVMTTPGIEGHLTKSNNVMEVFHVLGIEAARATIVREIQAVMNQMDIDPRHMQLLADVMTFKGNVLGITRHGMTQMRDSVLQLASFEKTPDHLFEAGAKAKLDLVEGVSECIIMGKTMSMGTGSFQVVKDLKFDEGDIGEKQCLFEDGWAWLCG